MCDVFLVLAQAPGGLSCFLLPRVLPDGTRNTLRSDAAEGQAGQPVQRLRRGGVRRRGRLAGRARRAGACAPSSRWSTDAAGLRDRLGGRHAQGARRRRVHHARHRSAFGRQLIDQPLMRNVLADLALESEAATTLMLRLAGATDRAMRGDRAEAAFRRIALAVGKYWVTKRGPAVTRRGAGVPGRQRLRRGVGDAPALTARRRCTRIWEGSGNVNALDVLRALGREPEAPEAFFAEVARRAGADARLDAAVGRLRDRAGRPGDVEVRPAGWWSGWRWSCRPPCWSGTRRPAVADAFCATRLAATGARLRHPAGGGGAGRDHGVLGGQRLLISATCWLARMKGEHPWRRHVPRRLSGRARCSTVRAPSLSTPPGWARSTCPGPRGPEQANGKTSPGGAHRGRALLVLLDGPVPWAGPGGHPAAVGGDQGRRDLPAG